jgi:hypothetical protein
MSKEERKKYWDSIEDQPDDHPDVDDWLDLLAGREVPEANPYNREFALMVRDAIKYQTEKKNGK